MGKKAKIGKQRKDRFYKLAKETGYRSRAAFKLIQLNRKFEFLQKSRVCIDLCAAPGGWMQVAHENMPASSIVIGVDLYPIKPVPGCLSVIGDIRTDKCRTDLSRELKTWKADLVLNDGAPNVGQNWLHDAFQQSTLTLSALKLATQFLRKGGWFITKVFRSKDYMALLHVMKELFKKVHATKPQASRDESAEIFVVCQGYLAPAKPDPKLLDPKHVFAELDLEPKHKVNIFNPDKQKKAKAEGYPENDYTLYHKVSVKDFINAENKGIAILEHASEIVIDDEQILNHNETTREIKECCKDIKVLGKKDFRLLINWQKSMKKLFGEKEPEKPTVEAEPDETKKDLTIEELEDMEDETIREEIQKLKKEEDRDLKRKKKKENKQKSKLQQKMNMNMVIKGDEGPREEDLDMFSLKQIKSRDQLKKVTDQSPDVLAESDEEDDVEKPKIVRYEKDVSHLDSSGLFYKDDESELEFSEDESDDDKSVKSDLGLSDSENDESLDKLPKKVRFAMDEKIDDDEEEEEQNPLITELDSTDKKTKKELRAALWFDKDIFKDIDNEMDEDFDIDQMIKMYKKQGIKVIGKNGEEENGEEEKKEVTSKKRDEIEIHSDSECNTDSDNDSDYDMNEFMTPEAVTKKVVEKVGGKDGFEVVVENKKKIKKRKLTEEDLALGTMIANSKKARRDIIDGGWNRYAFNDDNLPSWFIEDEKQHMKKNVPVPKEYVDDYKKRVEDITSRPIKKVMEAKARHKKRALRKLAKTKKKVEAVIDNADLSGREKAQQIKSLYKNATKEPKKDVKYVVAKKSLAGKRMARPAGVKGRYKVVDPRMKKDLRARKAKEKTKNRGKKGRSSKPPGGKAKPKGKKAR
ncbi:pre-rRNA processing protein FTSJ3 [Copidosoma floridanum]|uniref:pre-rRNA processing protein FTSJ3 n=1 Tax=Copidosoma floridanum TaxID=29053 RepID=UPI0006C9537F|nr:pre-rRNA processing protein FTSJ3 [Copidosoma floridanum]